MILLLDVRVIYEVEQWVDARPRSRVNVRAYYYVWATVVAEQWCKIKQWTIWGSQSCQQSYSHNCSIPKSYSSPHRSHKYSVPVPPRLKLLPRLVQPYALRVLGCRRFKLLYFTDYEKYRAPPDPKVVTCSAESIHGSICGHSLKLNIDRPCLEL